LGLYLKLAEQLNEQALQAGAKLIVLPELFNSSYRLEDGYSRCAEAMPGPSLDRISAIAQGEKTYLVALPELANGGYMFESCEEANSLAEPIPNEPTAQRWIRDMNIQGADTDL